MLDTAPMMRKPRTLFGSRANATPEDPSFDEAFAPYQRAEAPMPALPGPISGYGGGTWNTDGSPATPDAGGQMRPLPGSARTGGIFGRRSAASNDAVSRDAISIGEGGLRQMARTEAQGAAQAAPQAPQLGGSMRQPFDYDAALKALAGDQRKPKWWQYGLAILGDTLARQNGEQPYAVRHLASQAGSARERLQKAQETLLGWRHSDWQNQNEADLRASAPFTIGRDRMTWNPATGQTHTIYDGAEDFELYAEELGLEPGSEEYFNAVEDYVLRSNGPSAFERDKSLDDYRTNNDRELEAYRFGNRTALERLRQNYRTGLVDYRNANPPPSRARSAGSRPTATDAKGNKVEWDGSRWVPVR